MHASAYFYRLFLGFINANFATKYSYFSNVRELHDVHAIFFLLLFFAPLRSQTFTFVATNGAQNTRGVLDARRRQLEKAGSKKLVLKKADFAAGCRGARRALRLCSGPGPGQRVHAEEPRHSRRGAARLSTPLARWAIELRVRRPISVRKARGRVSLRP